MNKTLEYLQQKQWSMGSGQCPECCGVSEAWYGQPGHTNPGTIGHRASCQTAKAINTLGGTVIIQGEYNPDETTKIKNCVCGQKAEQWTAAGWVITGCKTCGTGAAAYKSFAQSATDWARIVNALQKAKQ